MNEESEGECQFLNTGSGLIGRGYRYLTVLVVDVKEHKGNCDAIWQSEGKGVQHGVQVLILLKRVICNPHLIVNCWVRRFD